MKVLNNLLKINGQCVYQNYGAFLVEERQGDLSNYEELLKPPAMKPYTSVSFREEDGEKLPERLPSPCFEARDVTLYFALVAENKQSWMSNYDKFVRMLKSGEKANGEKGGGWLRIEVAELGKTYKMYYKQCSQYSQITPLEDGKTVAAKLKVVLREPNPAV